MLAMLLPDESNSNLLQFELKMMATFCQRVVFLDMYFVGLVRIVLCPLRNEATNSLPVALLLLVVQSAHGPWLYVK